MTDFSTEGRRYPRYQVALPVSIVLEGEAGTGSDTALLQDISLTGLAWTSALAVPEGRQIAVGIELGGRDYRVRVRVERSRPMEEGHAVAALFMRGDEILPFLADLATFLRRQPPSALVG